MHIPLHVRYLQHCSHKSYFFQQNAVVQVKNAELNEAKHELHSEVKTLQSEVGFVQQPIWYFYFLGKKLIYVTHFLLS